MMRNQFFWNMMLHHWMSGISGCILGSEGSCSPWNIRNCFHCDAASSMKMGSSSTMPWESQNLYRLLKRITLFWWNIKTQQYLMWTEYWAVASYSRQ
jgi:hypothetical protein